jgi:two-component system NarL family sensor kinase
VSCALRGLPEFTRLVTRSKARSVIRMQEYHAAQIAGELHDEVLQALALTSRRLDDLRQSDEPTVIRATLTDAIDVLNEQSAVVGGIVSTLHPAVLRHVGLTDAIDTLAHQVAAANGLTVKVGISGDPQPGHTVDSEVSTAVYRVVQEALTNVVKHAAATIVHVTLGFGRNQLVITVSDDGRGVHDSDRRRSTGFGLENMRWRCESYGGSFALRRSDTGGTLVHATFPAL